LNTLIAEQDNVFDGYFTFFIFFDLNYVIQEGETRKQRRRSTLGKHLAAMSTPIQNSLKKIEQFAGNESSKHQMMKSYGCSLLELVASMMHHHDRANARAKQQHLSLMALNMIQIKVLF
jgi:hypothetical protein